MDDTEVWQPSSRPRHRSDIRPHPKWQTHLDAAFKARAAIPRVLLGPLVVLGGSYLQLGPNVFWVCVLLLITVAELHKRIDRGLPVMQIAAVVAVLQWTVGPVLEYSTPLVMADRHRMYVEESVYFAYALPGTAAFVLGLFSTGLSVPRHGPLVFFRPHSFLFIGLSLYAIAFAARITSSYFPELAFAFHLLSQLAYVGVPYILFSGSPLRWPLIALGVLPLFSATTEAAMFHDFLLWMTLLFTFWYGTRRHTGLEKVALLTCGAFLVFSMQAVKIQYRQKVRDGIEASVVEEAIRFLSDWDDTLTDEVVGKAIVRLNQGWIISAVLDHVPNRERYANGETVLDAVVGSLVPRMFAPDKIEAGGRVNFRRFTGLAIAETTSMGISPLGEAYANFGPDGGVLFMLVFGLALSGAYRVTLTRRAKYPDFVFWIPLIFYQALKAETELATVMNQLTKAALVAYVLHWALVSHVVPALARAPVARRRRWRRPASSTG